MHSEPSTPVEHTRHSWPADPDLATALRETVRDWLSALPLSAEAVAGLIVAVDAAAENAIKHAYEPGALGSVELMLSTDPEMLTIEVVDYGMWRPHDVDAHLGRGIRLMEAFVESVDIRVDGRGTRVSLRQPLRSAGRRAQPLDQWRRSAPPCCPSA
jgi:anti-sigma regulatory factor (Ser/Thr protein kinase)